MTESNSMTHRIADHVQAVPPSGIREFFELVQGRPDVISLGVGEPDFVTPWHIREAAIYSLERGKTSYTSNLGLLKLREAIGGYVEKHFGPAYEPDNEILVTVGVSEALDLALRALINPGDEIIYHEPCYVSYSPSIALAHGVAVPVPCRAEEKFSVTAAALAAAITPRSKVLVLNFPTNPTGGTMTRGELQAIADLAERHDLIVITDEIYAELTFEGEHVSIASLPGMRARTIFLHGFSKAYAMTGFRLGFACGPAELIRAMTRIHQYSMLCASITSQEAALEAIRNGTGPMLEMREAYRQRRNFMVRALNDMGLECHLPRGSFYAFPSVQSTGLASRDFATQLLSVENVAAVPGEAFGGSGEGFIRCCFAAGFEKIKIAMERMARFVAATKKG
jgi:aminotransferase